MGASHQTSYNDPNQSVFCPLDGFCDGDDESWWCCDANGCAGGGYDMMKTWACDPDKNCVVCGAYWSDCQVKEDKKCKCHFL